MKKPLSVLVIGVLFGLALPLASQEPTEPARAFQSGAVVSAGAKATRMRGSITTMIGGDAAVYVTRATSVGISGWALIDRITITSETFGSELALDVAYGGLMVEHKPSPREDNFWALRVLLGAGNATVSLPLVSTEIAADNFGVVEPEILAGLSLLTFLKASAHVSYRFVYGVEDLPQVTGGQLRGVAASVSFSVGPF